MPPPSGNERTRLRWAAAFVIVSSAGYLALDGFSLFQMTRYQLQRPDVGRPLFNALAFAGTYLACLAALIAMQGHGRRVFRYFTYAVALASIGTQAGFSGVSANGFTVTEATIVGVEIEYAFDAMRFFFWDYAPSLLAAIVCIILLERVFIPRLPRIRSVWIGLAPLIAAVWGFQLLVVTDAKVDRLPIPFRVPLLVSYALHHQSVYVGARDDIVFQPSHEPIAEHVVLLVDESIRGDALGLNGNPLATTPYLESIDARLFNYGIASSIANLSAPANLIMQSGLRPDELPDLEMRSMKNPSVFSYLEAAGYRTVLINAQNALARPPNFMSQADIADLDDYIQIREREPGLANHEPDTRVPALIREIVESSDRSFVYVIKDGAHFPYTGRYPPDQEIFTAEQFRDGLDGRQARVVAEYMNTVRHAADGFMRRLVPALDATGRNILVIYTSDHGQSLFEERDHRGKKIRGHGQHVDPPDEQANIPFFLIPFGARVREQIETRYHPALRDQLSAF